ncbi:MAG: site-specific DNA-methyltransferase [Elusimicrobia bacterium HGW-Elusimicrobia-1]|jgi:DNA modification methylase|nr:MAG: site-specific DNA-methyltransferase [Elusimicrobia bacterium HGW-Elusimicrobia-1]
MNDVGGVGTLENFELETTTVWSFPKRGAWATHGKNAAFRGNWAPQVVRNLIVRYTKPGDLVLDQMCGSGTTLIECKLLGRRAIGIDINPKMVRLARENLDFKSSARQAPVSVRLGDARHLSGIPDGSIDFIATHPPYVDIIKYSDGKIKSDLSNIHKLKDFCDEIKKVADECRRVLKPGKRCAILVGDTRRHGYYQPLAFGVMKAFLDSGFKLKEDIIKRQWNCKATPLWATLSKKYNFHLIMHEHLFVFDK